MWFRIKILFCLLLPMKQQNKKVLQNMCIFAKGVPIINVDPYWWLEHHQMSIIGPAWHPRQPAWQSNTPMAGGYSSKVAKCLKNLLVQRKSKKWSAGQEVWIFPPRWWFLFKPNARGLQGRPQQLNLRVFPKINATWLVNKKWLQKNPKEDPLIALEQSPMDTESDPA